MHKTWRNTMSTFDPHIEAGGVDLIKGEFTNLQCLDPALGIAGSLANHVMDRKHPFSIAMKWTLTGPLATLWLNNALGAGEGWSVDVFAESIGPGPELRIGSANVTITDPSRHIFEATVVVPANNL